MAEVRRCSSLLKKLPTNLAQNVESKIDSVPAILQEKTMSDVRQLVPRHPAPSFCAQAVLGGKIQEVSLLDYEGRWLVLVFSPLGDSIEKEQLLAFSDSIKSFQERGAELVASSCDSIWEQLYLTARTEEQGGVGHIAFPLISDDNGQLARKFGVMGDVCNSKKTPLRAMFLIDPEGTIRSVSIDDEGQGWRAEQWVYDSLRKLQELSAGETDYCPREKKDEHEDLPILEEKEDTPVSAQQSYENVPEEEGKSSEPLATNQMIVVVKGPSYQEVHFKVKKSTTFKQIIASYCKEMDLDIDRVKFSFQGERVFKDLTPPEVGMSSGDRLHCYKIRC